MIEHIAHTNHLFIISQLGGVLVQDPSCEKWSSDGRLNEAWQLSATAQEALRGAKRWARVISFAIHRLENGGSNHIGSE